MTTPLKVLLVEDNAADAELILHALRRAGFDPDVRRIDQASELQAALDPSLDLILTDYQLPQFTGLHVVKTVRAAGSDVPVIIVSGAIGEEVAVEALRQGADDYLLKDRLGRLDSAVTNALAQRRLRQEKRVSDEALRESEAHLKNILDNASEAIISVDEAQRITLFNSRAEKMFGYRVEEIIGQPLDLLIPAALVSIHRQHAHDFVHLDNTGHLMRMGRELTCRRKDGSEFPGEIGLSRLIENGQVTITAIVADITERKQAEAAVRESKSSLQAVLQSTADGILAVGSDNEVLYSNERFAEMWRIPPTVIADKDDVVLLQHVLDQLVDPQSFLQKVQELYRSVEESFDSLYFKDGRVFERLSQPLIQESKLHGRVWSFRDITSRKQAEAERQTLLEIMQAAATTEDLHSFLGLVHQSVAKVIWAENFFVTLYNQTTGLFEEAFSIDQHDQSPTPPARFEKSISAYVFRTGRPLLMNQAQFDVLQDAGEVELIGANSPSWLGVPLKTARGTIGVMVVQDYEQADRYSERDQNFLTSIAAQAALAVERKRAEEALLESEKRFRALIESSSDAITLLGATGKVIYDSPSAPGMLGYGPEDWIGRDVFALIHPEDLPRIQGLFEHLRQTAGARVNFTLRTRHKSGSWLWLEMVATNLLAEPGVNAIVLNYRDVTERKRAETLQNAVYDIAQASALADSLTNLFPQIQRIISGIMPAENFYIALYDQKHNQLSFPYSIDEVDQTYTGEEIEPGRGLTAYVLRTGKSLLCTGSIHKQLVEQGELEQIGVSMQIWLGVPLIVQAKVIGVMVVQHYSDPQAYGEREQRVLEYVSGQVALAIDRKQAEEALAASEAELRALFAAMHDAVLVIDRAGVYREIAPTNLESDLELHRLSPQELLGKKLQDVFPAEQAETFYNVIRRVLATQQIEQIEYELNFNSQAVWYEASISPMSADSTLWVARDITERKRAEEVIQKTESDYRYLFNNANDAIIIFEPEQEIILEANAAACAIYGFAHAELVGLSLKKLTKDLTKGETQVHELLEMGSYHDFESIHLNRKGEQINFLINSSVIEYQGRPAILSLNRDITERKRAEELLRTKVEILQALSEIEHEIIATNDPQGILDLVCRRAAALVHVSKSVITSIGPSGDLELAAHFGLSDPAGFNTIFKRLRQTRRLGGISLAARQMVVLPDPSAMDGPLSELAAGENINAAVIVPLAAYEKATGALVVFNAVPRAWTTDEVSVLNTLAGQAAIALQNARLFQEINRRAERLALLNRISHAVSMTLDIDELLEIVYREVTAKVESEVYLAALYDDQTNELDFRIRVDRGVRQPPERHPLRTGMSGLIIGTKQPVLVRDFEREKAQLPPVSLWGSMEAPRSWLGVPMLLGERVLGVIAVQHYRPNIYNEDDQRLLVTIADSVAVAVENARLYTMQERRAARLAEIVKLGIELGTLQDEYLMLKTLVARTAAIAQSDTCTVLWKEQTNVLTLAAQIGLPENTPLGLPISLPDLPFIHRTLSNGEPLILSDIDQQAPAVRALLVRSDLHSFFAYPMLGLKEIIGVITLSYIVAHKPSQEEINAYQLLAHRAAGAIEDARLFHTEHEQRTWAEALSDTAAALNATLDFDELLDQILANVGRVVPHDAASIMVSESGVARVVRYRGLAERDVVEVTAQLRLQVDEVDDLRRMSETGQAVIIEDTHAASGWTAVPETNWLASSLGAPIRVKGQVIGFISLGSAVPKFFTPMHAARLQSFADQAASALHNAQLLAETQQRAEQFTLLHETVRDLQFQPDVPTLLGIIVDRAKLLLHAPGGFIYLYDAAHSELE
ncbi:MAG TPA: PAS domain S-box protein, partial [Anaerolineae bacterium]|nr:PAS domain S-box protein [Anaerolineae bacterium]